MISTSDNLETNIHEIKATRAGLKEMCDADPAIYGGPASGRLGKGVNDTLGMLLNIKNQLDRIEGMLAAAAKKKTKK